MGKIKVAIIGMGNCASSLIQGIHYYKNSDIESVNGLIHWDIGGYLPSDIDIVAAFDIDERKVGKDISQAIFERPNCTKTFCDNIPDYNVKVKMGQILDGYSEHMAQFDEDETFIISDESEMSKEQIIQYLKDSGAEVLVNYLPVGSEKASRFYAECALEANLAFINNIPVFIASDPQWIKRFEDKGLPIIGDDIKAQVGATIVHRTLIDLFKSRGVKVEKTYQLNTGGNTDFLNMLDRSRLASKKESKTEAVQAVANEPLEKRDIHVGPSDYVSWQDDNKVCFLRIEGKLFGDVDMNLELRLSVEDSPNSAGVSIDAIRCIKLALDRELSGVLEGPSAYYCKHPFKQMSDEQARIATDEFIHYIPEK